jgi:uncharacterized protein YcbK (DUF882 family)
MRYFEHREFDSPDLPGSGWMMKESFLFDLDDARHYAGVPFVVTSGYRTPEYNQSLLDRGYQASRNSSHMTGYAADIQAPNSAMRYAIVIGAMKAGITRIGIGSNFVHLDTDPTKTQNLIWTY